MDEGKNIVLSDHPFIQALLLKLGVDPDITQRCAIEIPPMGPVEITLVLYPRLKEGMGLPTTKRFNLREITDSD